MTRPRARGLFVPNPTRDVACHHLYFVRPAHTVRGHPLASAGVCGGCYSLSYSPVKGPRWLLAAARYRTRIARRITSLAWREAVAPM